MRTSRIVLFTLVAVALGSCTEATSIGEDAGPWDIGPIGPSLAVVEGVPAVCGTPTVTSLIADETVEVGTVSVMQDEVNVYVAYRTATAWPILKTALFVGSSAAAIPANNRGNPRPGQFPFKASHGDGLGEVVWEIPLATLSGSELVIAAFAEVGEAVEGAWGAGEEITPGRSWATYLTHTVTSCAAETVDETGGTLFTPGGGASITIEAGALSLPVDITIDPVTVEELQEYVEHRDAAGGALPSAGPQSAPALAPGDLTAAVYDLLPIEGTLWDFGPDGLEFSTSSTVVLRYEESKLPPGVNEEELGVFLINGVIPYLPAPSMVDPVANTITAQVDHFSFAFIAYRLPADVDLDVTNLALSGSSQAKVGSPMDFYVDVTNLGPDASRGGNVTYQAFGDVVPGGVFGPCTEIPNPIFGDVAVTCDVAALAVGANDAMPAFQVVAQSVGDVTIWATSSPAEGDVDGNADNNRQELVQAVGPAVEIDLSVRGLALSGSSNTEVGSPMDFFVDVINLGPDPSSGGTVIYQAFGDVTLGGVFGACTEITDPIFGDVAISCDVAALAVDANDAMPAFQVVGQSAGDVTIWATVSPATGDTDTNADNNREEITQPVGVAADVDLTVTNLALSGSSQAKVGSPMDFYADVTNLGPDASSGGNVTYQAFGDVVLGGVFGPCTEIPNPIFGDVAVACDVAALAVGANDAMPAFQLVAQSVGDVTIWAIVSTAAGDADGNADNNRQELVQPVGPAVEVDLSVTQLSLSSSSSAAIGSPMDFYADVTNLGPDASSGGTVTYQAFGDVALGGVFGGCTEIPNPIFGDVAISCAIAALAVGGNDAMPAFQVVAQSAGDVTIWATTSVAAGETDVDAANNRREVTTAVAGAQADLRVDRINDSPDPVSEGQDVTYDIDVIAVGTAAPVTGAVLQLLIPGGTTTFVSSTLSCTVIAGGVGCTLPTLVPSLVTTAQVVMTATTAGQTLQAEARVVVPAGVTDPILANNSLSQSTTVQSPQPTELRFGDIVETALPAPGDTAVYLFEGVPGDWVRVALAVLNDNNSAAQLVVEDPAGNEIFPGGVSRGRATDLSSANFVFQPTAPGTYAVKVLPVGSGDYRLGLGTGAGRLDPTYGPNGLGIVKGPRASSPRDPFWEMEQVGNDVLVIGEAALSKFDASGAPLAAFGSGGTVDLNAVLGSGRWGRAMRVQPDGRIVVAARSLLSPYPWVVARFGADGALDPTFGTGGITEVQLGNRSTSIPLGVRFQQNGGDLDIIVAGNGGALQEQVGLVRLNPDGSLDPGFGTNGIVFENGGFSPKGMDIQSDGRILLTDYRQIHRYTATGARDATFGVNGLVDYGISGTARGLLVLPDDRLLVLGDQAGDAFVMRLSAQGVRDAGFAGGGFALYDFGLTERFQAATLDGNGDLIVVGYQLTPGGDYEFLVSRMSANGVLDADFAVAGSLTEFQVDDARAVVMDSTGRILVGGQARGRVYGIELTRHLPN